MRIKKRLVSSLLVGSLLVSMVPSFAVAASGDSLLIVK